MKRKDIISRLKKYFDIRELVSKDVYNKFGQTAWRVFSTELLETLLVLRTDILKVPLVCNNWKAGGEFTQRGFRENISTIVRNKTIANSLYLSAHTIGKAVDLSSGKMSANEMRHTIAANAAKLPYKVRIESEQNAPTWLHIDTMTDDDTNSIISWF